MAARNANMADELKAITECSICTEVFTDPRLLPCIHTFCLKCIEKIGESREPGVSIPCPLCREEFSVPKEGLNGLRKNFFMSRIVDISKISSPPSKETLCDACLEDVEETPEIPLAQSFCVECHQNLCLDCCKHHRKNKVLKAHSILALGSKIDPEKLTESFPSTMCDQHRTKPLEMFCMTCQTAICIMCFAENHQQHRCTDVNKIVPDFRKTLLSDSGKASIMKADILKGSLTVKNAKENILVEIADIESRIISRGEELKLLVDQHTKALLDQLGSMKLNKLKEIEMEKDKIDRHLAILESYEVYCRSLAENGSASDVCQVTTELHKKAATLEIEHSSLMLLQVNSQRNLFQISTLQNWLNQNKNISGQITNLPVFSRPQQDFSKGIKKGPFPNPSRVYKQEFLNSDITMEEEMHYKKQNKN